MTIIGEIGREFVFFIAALSAIAFTRRAGIGDAAPNPANAVARVFEPNFAAMEQQMNDFAPKRPAATLENLMDSIDDTDADLEQAILNVERLIEQKRTLVATMRARLDLEDADIAARTAAVAKMREALRKEPAAAEPAETPQS